jgi:hypothetical protein
MSNNLLRIRSFSNFPREVNLLELDFIIQGYNYKYLAINNNSHSNLSI